MKAFKAGRALLDILLITVAILTLLDVRDRVALLEKATADANYLYVLHDGDKWDRLRTNQVGECATKVCAVFVGPLSPAPKVAR